MHLFQVWAPPAAGVDLLCNGQIVPMEPSGDGWWSAEVADAGHGTDYAYRPRPHNSPGPNDSSSPNAPGATVGLPDPRSAWQPHGVHGVSRVFDPSRYRWQTPHWPGRTVLGAVVYELHVGTFTPEGTLDAVIQHLDHLVALGIDVVELMPLAAFDGRWGWGYDGVDLYAVHQPYGGPEALQRFVDACHSRGLGVCLDVVYNHLGPSGNYLSAFGPYFTDTHRTPWGAAVNLDADGSHGVRRWIIDNALRWFEEFGLDALRLDAVHALIDDSPRHLLAQLADEVADLSQRLGRPLSLIAESDLNDPTMVEPTADGGRGMTAQWSDDFHHALHTLLTGERQGYYADFGSIDVLARTISMVFRHDGDWSSFRKADWGRPVDPSRHSGHQFLGYLQTHDQIGNRATGDRIGASLTPGRRAAGAALVLTSAFTPMIFMGEEWAASTPWQYFTDFDTELGALVRDGRRAEFGTHGWDAATVPDPQDPATRERSVLDWSESAAGEHADALHWYRELIALRRTEPDLASGDLRTVQVSRGADWLVVHRGAVDVLVNLGAQAQLLPSTATTILASWHNGGEPATGGILLPPDGVAIARR